MGITTGVSLFGISYMVPFAEHLGFGAMIVASSAGALSIINGVGRAATGAISDRIGRKQTLLVSVAALIGLLHTGLAKNEIAFIFFAVLVGFGGGAFYPLFATLTTHYFGENNNASNYGIVYSAKLVGSILGIGVGASVIDAWDYTGADRVAAGSALLSAGTAALLRQPGRSAKGRLGLRDRGSGYALGAVSGFLTPLMVDLAGAFGVTSHEVRGTLATACRDGLDQLGVFIPCVFAAG